MPTRLIDCRQLRLVETQGLLPEYPIGVPWISLSHCWGTKAGLKTTRKNYPDMLRSISLQDLPATIRDAIKFTIQLGWPYLWVDNLCIIQPDQEENADDQKDWEMELPKMGRYYKDSLLTLVIESAAGDDEGFLESLEQHEDRNTGLVSISIETDDGDAEFYVNFESYKMDLLSAHIFFERITPLRERAWTLQ